MRDGRAVLDELKPVRVCSERGAGSILAISLIAGILAALFLLVPLCAVMVERAGVAGAADAAALAAADVAIGIVPGIPCEMASWVAEVNGASLRECLVDGVIVTVRVSVAVFGFPVSSAATAGPAAAGR